MTERLKRADVGNLLDSINKRILSDTDYNQIKMGYTVVGALQIGSAYNAYRIEQITSPSRGIRVLDNGYTTLRNCHTFASGMLAALRLTQG